MPSAIAEHDPVPPGDDPAQQPARADVDDERERQRRRRSTGSERSADQAREHRQCAQRREDEVELARAGSRSSSLLVVAG